MPEVEYEDDLIEFPDWMTGDEISDVLGAMWAATQAAGEFVAVLGSGALEETASGLQGLGVAFKDYIPLRFGGSTGGGSPDFKAGSEATRGSQGKIAYQPRTRAGQIAMQSLGEDISALSDAAGLEHMSGYWRDRVVPALQEAAGPIGGSVLAAAGLTALTAVGEVTPGGRAVRTVSKVNQRGAIENLWHGSPTKFEEFDPFRTGDRITSLGAGHYLSPTKETAAAYGDELMEFAVDTEDFLDWKNMTQKQRAGVEAELLKYVPENRVSHFGKPKYEVLKKGKGGAARFRELQDKTKDAYHDQAKAQTLGDDDIPDDILSGLAPDDVVVRYMEGGDLSNANPEQLMTLMNEYSPELAKILGYKGARFGDQTVVYDATIPKIIKDTDIGSPIGLEGMDAKVTGKKVSHGSTQRIDEYQRGTTTTGRLGKGIYFTENEKRANLFASLRKRQGGESFVNKAEIFSDNPAIMTEDRLLQYPQGKFPSEAFEAEGFTGIQLINDAGEIIEETVFDPANVRSLN